MQLAKINKDGMIDLRDCHPDNTGKLFRLIDDGFLEFVSEDKPMTKDGELAIDHFEMKDNRIFQSWSIAVDVDYIEKKLQSMKDILATSDYKIIKCFEASLIGVEMPYNVTDLHNQRQLVRDEINRLEEHLEE